MNSAELAKQFKVTRRTAQRWIKAGCPADDPGAMALWIESHQAHFGRSKFMSGEPSERASTPPLASAQELTATDYDFTSTDKLIGNLSALAGRAMCDLEAARQTGSGPAVARASKVFNDAVHQLRQSLISRDQLQASAGASYSPEEIAFAAAQIFIGMRHLLTDQFPSMAEQVAWDKGVVDLKNRILLEAVIRDVIQTVVLPCLCNTGVHMAAMMSKTRKVSTVAQRRELFSAITTAWTPDEFTE
jgi:hypothetical protein